jgi:indolepyruvate ferredoxin oxidoreductase
VQIFLLQHDIAFVPGLNEDLAATAVWGSQQVGMFPGARVDGVFGIWYGKGPGVDRSLDALKHANSAGTSPNGGVIALAGDDHGCQSSTLAHQSEQVFRLGADAGGQSGHAAGVSRSRILWFCAVALFGCWVGFKAISETVESSASIVSDPDRIKVITPTISKCRRAGLASGGRTRRWSRSEGSTVRKWRQSRPSPALNRFDRIVLDSSKPARLGIMATGKAYLDLRQALADLGITGCDAQALGSAHLQGGADLAIGRARRARVSPRACRTCSWSRRSAASSRINWSASFTTWTPGSARPWSENATRAARRCCRAKAN